MNRVVAFLKRWGLVVSMLTGACAYITFINIEPLQVCKPLLSKAISISQPTLLFMMLLLTFLKVKPSDLNLRKWQLGALLLQGLVWIGGAWLMSSIPLSENWRLGIEGFLLCMICPTATAAAVVTGKLGGNQGSLTMYIILANLLASALIPAMIPMICPKAEVDFLTTFWQIVAKIFPLLFSPFLCAIIIRRLLPGVTRWLTSIPNAAFYLWMMALSIAIAVSVKIMHQSFMAGSGIAPQLSIAVGSLLAAFIQFTAGKWLGKNISNYSSNEIISSTQALGQKNTIFSIWCGYTFMDPLSSIAGGFYSIWHNIYNSYQLAKRNSPS